MFPGFILRPLYQTMNSSGQQENRGDTDKLKLTANNEVHSVHTHIPSRQPPSSYCAAHKCSHPQDHCSRARAGSSAPCEEPQWGRGGAVRGQAGYKVPSAAGTLDWGDGQCRQCAAVVKVKVKVGQGASFKRKEGGGVFVIHWGWELDHVSLGVLDAEMPHQVNWSSLLPWKQEFWS